MRWALLFVAACGRLGFEPIGADDAVDATPTGGGASTIAGIAPDGTLFDVVQAAYVIGHPRIAGQTSIYLLSTSVDCAAMGATGWGQRIAAGTQTLELVLGGTAASLYPVTGNDPPHAAQGAGRYHYAYGNGELAIGGSSGQVTVTAAGRDGVVDGEFSVSFSPSHVLAGVFVAAYCADGTYP